MDMFFHDLQSGTCFHFSIYIYVYIYIYIYQEFHHPHWGTHIFQRSRYSSTNQINIYINIYIDICKHVSQHLHIYIYVYIYISIHHYCIHLENLCTLVQCVYSGWPDLGSEVLGRGCAQHFRELLHQAGCRPRGADEI